MAAASSDITNSMNNTRIVVRQNVMGFALAFFFNRNKQQDGNNYILQLRLTAQSQDIASLNLQLNSFFRKTYNRPQSKKQQDLIKTSRTIGLSSSQSYCPRGNVV